MAEQRQPIRVAQTASPVATLGPGRRFVLWVQGCRKRCPGCTSPEWRPQEGGSLLAVAEMQRAILEQDERPAPLGQLDGLTLSGGEPLLQAGPLLELWRGLLVARPAWTLVLFTGYSQRELARRPDAAAQELARTADLLIAGPYIAALDDGRGLRGSSNQQILIRNPALLPLAGELLTAPRRLELRLTADVAFFAGVPPRGFGEQLDRLLGQEEP